MTNIDDWRYLIIHFQGCFQTRNKVSFHYLLYSIFSQLRILGISLYNHQNFTPKLRSGIMYACLKGTPWQAPEHQFCH
jgi:hypothetical protein